MEIWKPIIGWPYEVSNLGRVRRSRANGHGTFPGRILRQCLVGKQKRPAVGLCRNGKQKLFKVHKLVCRAFHGQPPSAKHEVAHWDGNVTNNRASNLRWATRRENVADAIRHGTHNTATARAARIRKLHQL